MKRKTQAEWNREIRELEKAGSKYLKESLTSHLGPPIVIREKGRVIRCRLWLRPVKTIADTHLVRLLDTTVRRLKTTLPVDTGRLRRSTRRIVYAVDQRSFRVYSFAPYSKFVITAPPVWRRWASWLAHRLRSTTGTARLECTLQVGSGKPRKRIVKYPFKLSKLQPRARTFAQASLQNEIRGTYKPVMSLRQDVRAVIRRQLLK